MTNLFRKVIKAMFDKLAHASIMRLNAASMDKLYDLMTMAVKHQVSPGPPWHLYRNASVCLIKKICVQNYTTRGPST